MHVQAVPLRFAFVLSTSVLLVGPARAQLVVTEVMYDPASSEPGWEWIEVYNPGPTFVDLNGYFVDRVGDAALGAAPTPQIRSTVSTPDGDVSNATVVFAGGVAVLFNGEGLGWDRQRFRSAWPSLPANTPLIGVDGWTRNSLTNNPAPPTIDDSLPGLTFGFWASEAAYRADVANVGLPGDPDNRVAGVGSAAFSFSYDDSDDWPSNNGESSIVYVGEGEAGDGADWAISDPADGTSVTSLPTFLPGAPINGADFGSPGQTPGSAATVAGGSLLITEVMYNPASIAGSTEWEWIEVLNRGTTAVDFATTPHWLDDDDGGSLSGPNVAAGAIAPGEAAVLFNAGAASLEEMRAAWETDGGINLIPVESWPVLANGGDLVALWDDLSSYAAGKANDDATGAVTAVAYDDVSPWPSDNGTDAIYLTDLTAAANEGASWARSSDDPADPNGYQATEVFSSGLADNSGADIGSPGRLPGTPVTVLPGDYNGDGSVDAADYTVWREGGPLRNETATPGTVDSEDYVAWRNSYADGVRISEIPEASTLSLFLTFPGCGRTRRRV